MSKEITISERIKKLRARFGLTQEELAQNMRFTRSYISQLEAGVKEPGPRFIKKLLACEQSPEPIKWQMTEGEGAELTETSSSEYNLPTVKAVPLISWAQAGLATEFEEIPEDWREWISIPISDPKAFAIVLRGDSMEPRFQEGDIAVLLPSITPRNGDLVVANIRDEGFAFKILNLIGGDPNQIKLTSYNPVYSPMEYPKEKFFWIYPVDSVTKRIRR